MKRVRRNKNLRSKKMSVEEMAYDLKNQNLTGQRKSRNTEHKILREDVSLQLRMRSLWYSQIAEMTGVSIAQAYNDVQTALQREIDLNNKTRQHYRKIEERKLNELESALYKQAAYGTPLLNTKGEQVKYPDGDPVMIIDKKATSQILQIMKRKSELLGLDKPQRKLLGQDPDHPMLFPDMEEKALSLLQRFIPAEEEDE